MAKRGRPKGSFRPHPPGERDYAMKALSDEGKTLAEIGEVYGITRERVRQLLTKYFGINKDNSARSKIISFRKCHALKSKSDESHNKREVRCYEVYGCSIDTAKQINGGEIPFSTGRTTSPAHAYFNQRHSAFLRGIGWNISFPEWWEIWQESGKYHLRGRGYGYAMARYGDSGAYEVGNVYICTGAQNSSDSYLVHPATERTEKAKKTRELRRSHEEPMAATA